MDIDRTPELLTWIFSGMFGKKEERQPVRVGPRQCAIAGLRRRGLRWL